MMIAVSTMKFDRKMIKEAVDKLHLFMLYL